MPTRHIWIHDAKLKMYLFIGFVRLRTEFIWVSLKGQCPGGGGGAHFHVKGAGMLVVSRLA